MAKLLKTPIQGYECTGKCGTERRRMSDRLSSKLPADETVQFLLTANRSKPFFLSTGFTAPHNPRLLDKLKLPETSCRNIRSTMAGCR